MTTKTWNFTLEDQPHTLTLEHGVLSRKPIVVLDGQRLESIRADIVKSGSAHEYQVAGHSLVVIIKSKLFGFAYDPVVDGASITTGSRDTIWRMKGKEPISKNEGSWQKLPERIEPILHLRQLVGKIALSVILILLIITPIIVIPALVLAPRGRPVLFCTFVPYALLVAVFGNAAYGFLRDVIEGLRGRSRFLQSQSHTVAQILRRRIVTYKDQYDNYSYTYHLQLKFTPTLTTASTGSLQLEARISEDLYEKLLNSQSAGITYAVEIPAVFVIEGE